MPRLLRAMALLGMLLIAQGVSAQKLRIAGDAWAPYSDLSLINGGLSTDLVRTALGRAGYTTEYEQVPWARAVHGVSEGRYDILINAWYSTERTQIGEFSGEYLVNRLRFLKRKTSDITYQTLPQLHPYSIAVVRSYAYSPEFDNDPDLKKVPVASFSTAVRMLAAGRVELTVEDEYAARFALSHEPADVRGNVDFLPQSLSENGLHILVSLKNPDHAKIVADFDEAVAAMKADGSYDKLFKLHGL
ncbi:substrate-binding periplasmic protein [Pseudomonas sp. UBA1879]|uniref:substrate-binding periplasmic protein n=1 Tax=Pseudomonas sp. UBA1879 TaxID=1947305 RepID=UPI0025F2A130|nr:transporter substrate-binding domain-containing protein [Pseudomonas sp. UBA1879]